MERERERERDWQRGWDDGATSARRLAVATTMWTFRGRLSWSTTSWTKACPASTSRWSRMEVSGWETEREITTTRSGRCTAPYHDTYTSTCSLPFASMHRRVWTRTTSVDDARFSKDPSPKRMRPETNAVQPSTLIFASVSSQHRRSCGSSTRSCARLKERQRQARNRKRDRDVRSGAWHFRSIRKTIRCGEISPSAATNCTTSCKKDLTW